MKRKFFSTLLFGALACATLGTVTSCKDYDDDINNLQEQINKAALSSDVEALKTQVTNAATSAQNAATKAEEALTKAGTNATEIASVKALATENGTKVATALTNAANAAADAQAAAQAAQAAQDSANVALNKIAGLDSELKALAASAQTHVTATQLKASLDSLADVINQATSDSIAKLTTVVNGYKGGINALYTAVTEVSLVGSFTNGEFITPGDGKLSMSPFDLIFVTGTTGSSDFTFGTKQKDDSDSYANDANSTYKYAKNTQIDFPKTIVVRINPVNANVTPDMIKLIDSQGNDLDNVIKVKSVSKYNQLLTRASETGLWTVELAIADGVAASKVKQTAPGDDSKYVLYALGVNNTAAQAETAADAASRYVVSTYDITLKGTTAYQKATCENGMEGLELKSETQQPTWTSISKISGRGTNHITRESTTKDLLAANGENIYVRFNTAKTPNAANIDRFYIVRDDNHAETASSPSEINVWNTYKYSESLGDIVEVKNGEGIATFTATIPSNLATGDQIAFRVFAVNYDGTLVCQTGESFNVTIVNNQTAASVAGEIVATSATPSTEWLPITGTLTDTGNLPTSVTVGLAGSTCTLNVQYAKDANGTTYSKNSEVKYVKFTATSDIKAWKDNATYTGNITTTGSKNETANNIAVSLTKKLPTVNDKKYTWKPNQLVDGTYTAYLFPDNTTEATARWQSDLATNGKQDMNAVITGLADGDEFTIDGIKLNSNKDAYSESATFTDDIISVPVATVGGVSLIDNTTAHKMTISHNYGKVSSESDNDVVVAYETVNVIFADPLAKVWQAIDWADIKTGTDADGNAIYAKGGYLTYGKSNTLMDTPFLALLKATNHFDNTKFGGSLKTLLQGDGTFNAKYQSLVSVTDKSKYFEFEINANKNGISKITPIITSNPTADVSTTLEIVLKSAFGVKYTYELPFTVKRAE